MISEVSFNHQLTLVKLKYKLQTLIATFEIVRHKGLRLLSQISSVSNTASPMR